LYDSVHLNKKWMASKAFDYLNVKWWILFHLALYMKGSAQNLRADQFYSKKNIKGSFLW
jgi:hypothetical protein